MMQMHQPAVISCPRGNIVTLPSKIQDHNFFLRDTTM